MILFHIYNLPPYNHLLLKVDGLSQFSASIFNLTEFDLSEIFDVQLIPSRHDKIEDGELVFKIKDTLLPIEYIAKLTIVKKKVKSFILDQ